MIRREPSREDSIIERFFRPLAKHPGALALGDDAALLPPQAGFDFVITADTTTAGVHFFPDDPADLIAKKALRVNLSDLAAKGAEPVGATLALSMSAATGEVWLEKFARGLGEDCEAFACPLLGGDTTKTPGPLSISITAIGKVPSGQMVKRAGARAGDLVVVSGTIGDAALGLLALKREGLIGGLSREQIPELVRRYRVPEPRLALAPVLREYANAAMDISDGLAGDLAKLAAQSGVGAFIETARLPLSGPAENALRNEQSITGLIDDPHMLSTILTGGDDYEVLCAIPETEFHAFAEAAGAAGVPVTAIGRFESGGEVEVLGSKGQRITLDRLSYSHF